MSALCQKRTFREQPYLSPASLLEAGTRLKHQKIKPPGKRHCHINRYRTSFLVVGYRGLCRGGHVPPLLHRFSAELTKCAAGDQMALRVEDVVDGSVGGEETLR